MVPSANDVRCKLGLFTKTTDQRTFAVILETGEEACLQRFMTRENVLAAQITAIGAFSDVVLMYFDWDKHTSAPAIASSGKWRTL